MKGFFENVAEYVSDLQGFHWMLIGYTIITLVIAFIGSRKRSTEDYLIAGRKVGLIGFVTSVVASYIGGAALVAFAAYVFQFGVSAFAVFIGTAVGFFVFIPYAKKLKLQSDGCNFYTLMDWLYFKFDKRTGHLASAILSIVYLGMLLNQFIAGSMILAGMSNWSYESALLLSSVIIAIYLTAGGFQSVIRTDIFQYLVLMVIMVVMSKVMVSGDTKIASQLTNFTTADPAMLIAFLAFGVLIVFQSAEYWQRVYAAKNMKVVVRGFRWSAVLTLITGIVITIISLTARDLAPGIQPSEAFGAGLKLILPGSIVAMALVMVFAAIMSSADTQIFVISTALSLDLVGKNTKKKLSDKQLQNLTKLFVLVLIAIAAALAYFVRDLIEVIKFITGLGFTIIPACIGSFHFNIPPKAASGSFIAGILYICVLMITGLMIPELAIASILVSTLYLIIATQIIKHHRK